MKNLVSINILSKLVSIPIILFSSMDTKVGADGTGICVNVSEASPPYIWRSKWAATLRNSLWDGCYAQKLYLKVNYISIGAAILDPSNHSLALRVPFILIEYCQWGLMIIAFLGAYMGLPNIPRSCIWLSFFILPCPHSSHVESLFRFILVKLSRD